MTSALLLDEPCIVIQPALVRALGQLSDAAVLQQLHYWQSRATAEHDGRLWVYKTYEEWSDEIGISPKQIRASIGRLWSAGLIESCQPEAYHRRKWYRIRYDAPLLAGSPSAPQGASICPHGPMDRTERAHGSAHMGASITESTTESTTETSKKPQTPETSDVDPETESRLAECHRLGHLLADRIEKNGARRPTVSKAWIRSLDRMIRLDERTPIQIERAIEWATSHSFWSTNILSPDALRRHYDRMALQARRDASESGPRGMSGVRQFLADLDSDYGQLTPGGLQ